MLNKLKKIDKNYFIIILLSLLLVIISVPSNYLFGSLTDWITQHISFPDYFRKLFYETGNIFPSFAPSIGAGQNIFNFAYYGLYSPLFLLSYLLPFIDMTTYIIGINIIIYIITGILFYKFFKSHYSRSTSLIVTIIIICASPLLYHSHRHYMFVSYMPFLIMGLFGVDAYFERNNKILLIISVFLLILTNYFFSVSSLSVILLYGLFTYLKKENKISFKKIVIEGFKFLIPIILGILLASFILLPTAYTLLNGRSTGNIDLVKSLKPDLDYSRLLYSSYTLGLTSLSIISLIYGIKSNKEYKVLSIIILVLISIPIFCLIFNGFLYIREKVFIPYLVLFGLFICNLFENIKKIDKKNLFLFTIFLIIFILFKARLYFIIDYVITIFLIYSLKDRKKFLYAIISLIVITSCVIVNKNENYVSKDIYNNIIEDSNEINKIQYNDKYRFYHLDDDLYTTDRIYTNNYHIDSIYSSTYNKEYYNFYKNIFKNPFSYRNEMILSQTKNLLFQTYMGAKYMYSDSDMLGYEKVSKHIYENENILPIIYGTDRIINEKEFDKLDYPYTIESLFKGVITKENSNIDISKSMRQTDLNYIIKSSNGLKIEKKDNILNIIAEKNNNLVLELEENIRDEIILIDFKLKEEWDCSKGDSKITINGVSNILTCKDWMYKNRNNNFHFYIAEDNLKKLNINFNKGEYNIEDINIYKLDYGEILDYVNSVYKPKYININGDQIKTKIDVVNDGYIVTSIPYDNGFEVYDNGEKIKVEKVNKSFVGFKVKKGLHEIEIYYKAPLFKEGIIISLGIFIILIAYIFINNKKNKKISKKVLSKS